MLIKIGIICAALAGSVSVLIIHEKSAPAAPKALTPAVLRQPTAEERSVLKGLTSVAPKRKREEMH